MVVSFMIAVPFALVPPPRGRPHPCYEHHHPIRHRHPDFFNELSGTPGVSNPTARQFAATALHFLKAEGEAAFEPRSRRPKTSPSAISPDTVELITRLRKELAGQGLDAGPQTIAWHLEHHHQVKVSPATVSRCLARQGLVTPDPSKRPKSSCIRFAAEMPNECWQSDFTHYPLAGGRTPRS